MRTWIAICNPDHISNKSVGKDQSSVRSVSCKFVRFCPQITFSICRLNLTVAERGQQEGGIFWWIGQVKEVERSVDLCLGRKSDNFGKSCNFRIRRGRADVTRGDEPTRLEICQKIYMIRFSRKKRSRQISTLGPTSQYLGNRPISNFCKFARHFRSSNADRSSDENWKITQHRKTRSWPSISKKNFFLQTFTIMLAFYRNSLNRTSSELYWCVKIAFYCHFVSCSVRYVRLVNSDGKIVGCWLHKKILLKKCSRPATYHPGPPPASDAIFLPRPPATPATCAPSLPAFNLFCWTFIFLSLSLPDLLPRRLGSTSQLN